MTPKHALASLPQRLQEAGLDWIVPDWPAPPQVQAFSTTRNGKAAAPFDLSRDAPANVAARETPCAAAPYNAASSEAGSTPAASSRSPSARSKRRKIEN